MADFTLHPQKTALLFADYYAHAFDVPHATERNVLKNAQALREAARGVGIPVLYCATVFREGFPEVSPNNRIFSRIKSSGQMVVSNPAERIHPSMAPGPGEVVIGKHRVNPFIGTDLDMILRANGIEALVLAGTSTSGCVLSIVRYGADADYHVVLVEDCCVEPELGVHDFLLERIFPRYATITTANEVIKVITGK